MLGSSGEQAGALSAQLCVGRVEVLLENGLDRGHRVCTASVALAATRTTLLLRSAHHVSHDHFPLRLRRRARPTPALTGAETASAAPPLPRPVERDVRARRSSDMHHFGDV
jgi:hypothetical protein